MNDQDRFIWDVSTPYLPAQADNWGWPDLEIEEIRLNRDTSYERFVAGISAAIEPATEPYRTTNLEWHLFNDLTYDLLHTLPFVCDQVLTYPRTSALMFVGTRADFVSRFVAAWRGMGFTGPILIPDDCKGLPVDIKGVETGSFGDLLRRADMFIFEFGLATQGLHDPVRTGRMLEALDAKRLKVVERLFRQAASLELETRPKHRRLPRRFIGVNVIYNKYWPLFTDYVSANINPFCGQVLAGAPRIDPSVKGKVLRLRGRYAI
jgi:hypothetical protein